MHNLLSVILLDKIKNCSTLYFRINIMGIRIFLCYKVLIVNIEWLILTFCKLCLHHTILVLILLNCQMSLLGGYLFH